MRTGVLLVIAWTAGRLLGSVGPQPVLDLPPSAENCRNSEGDFARLEDGSILFVYSHYVRGTGGDHDPAHLAARVSKDGGRTWSTRDETVVANEGGLNVMSVSLLRLKDGSLALFYLCKNSETDCRPVMRVSRDEGKTWGAPVKCVADADIGYYVLNNARAERLESGRIALPLCLHESKGGKIGDWAGKLVCAVSDDEGVTWRLGGTPFPTFDEKGKRVTTQEPGLVQLKDGRVLMYARTDRGRQWFFYSSDGCRTWTKGEPGTLWGPLAPATVKRLKTGDLLAVWNDHENRPDASKAGPAWSHGVRRPQTVAISRDEGKTWVNRRTLEDKSDGWYCYTAVLECGDSLILGYCAEKMLKHSRLVRVPLDWIYGRPSAPPVADFRKRAQTRIAEIRATPNRDVPSGAKAYYVSEIRGDDASDGRTPATAWRTCARLNAQGVLDVGSWVLFERGGTYRGTVRACRGVTYTAYGTGPKPCIVGSPENGAVPAKWVRTENPKVWAYAIGPRDVGMIVFDEGAAHGVKIVPRTDRKTGVRTNLFTGRPFASYRDLDGDLHFWHDYGEGRSGNVYLCSETNPGERFKSIEFCVWGNGFGVGDRSDVTIDNFAVKYVGRHGVAAATCRNLTVANCEFAWNGGSIQGEGLFGRDHPTRLGNGVEIWGGCDGFVVTNCYLHDVYDAALTHQFDLPDKDGRRRCDQRNVRFADNVLERCNYGIEYFLRVPKDNPSVIENVVYENNLMIEIGEGFCAERPDRGGAAAVKTWKSVRNSPIRNFVVRDSGACPQGE